MVPSSQNYLESTINTFGHFWYGAKKNKTFLMRSPIRQNGKICALVCFTILLTIIIIFNKIFPPIYSDKLAENFQSNKASHPNFGPKPKRDGSQSIFRLQSGSASSNSLMLLDNIRADNRFSSAIDTFDNIQSEINKTPPGLSDARKIRTLEALKKKIFIDDFRYISMSLGLDCSQAEIAFDKINQSPVKLLDQSVNEDFPGTRSPPNNVLSEYYGRILDSGNPGYNDILNALSFQDVKDVMSDQILMDSLTYVGLKTYLEQLIEDEVKHGKGIQNHYETIAGDSDISKAYAATVNNTASEMTRILDSYRSIYQRRMTRQLGEKGKELMDLLSSIKLSGVGMELGVPCL